MKMMISSSSIYEKLINESEEEILTIIRGIKTSLLD